MDPSTPDYEKLGAFYLGRQHDLESGDTANLPILYDSKDLTTHAVIIGMTGSGKTGLGIGLIEEAAIDRIPVIAIDPKGDMGNLLLSFPNLAPSDFRPWINPAEAESSGLDPDAFAEKVATRWQEGLAKWDQDGERIRRMRAAADFAIYTPGSSSGRPIALLKSFHAPRASLRDDADLYRDHIEATVTSVLGLIKIDSDPLTGREHILLASLLRHAWDSGRNLELGQLIASIQQPPFDTIGVMDLETFYSAKDRFALAMKLNALLAAPGFEAWMTGDPLDAGRLLYTESGQPRVAVLSIAHLSEPERMFFVTMLLAEVTSWMRAQSGTTSLRAILYMDEVAGYLPPVAMPPSKKPFLTLLKQARAYGLGLVLATQNPVDLDYKALSNAGTWCLGRLQTERDKARVMEGLEGTGGTFDRAEMEKTLAGLGKRIFLLHNVHEDEPVVFETRWVMSFLGGPLTRDQIKQLIPSTEETKDDSATTPPPAQAPLMTVSTTPPILPPEVRQLFVPLSRSGPDGATLTWTPRVVGVVDVAYLDARRRIDHRAQFILLATVEDGPLPLDWNQADDLDLAAEDLSAAPPSDAVYGEVPPPLHRSKQFTKWEKDLNRWVRDNRALVLWESAALKQRSEPGETEGAFRGRLQLAYREARDAKVEALRDKYAPKVATIEDRIRRAEQRVAVESSQASTQKMSALLWAGTAVLGSLLGRKRFGVGTANRVGTAMRGAGRARKEAQDVTRAAENVEAQKEKLIVLEEKLADDIAMIEEQYDGASEELTTVTIKPKVRDTTVRLVALAWAPVWDDHGKAQNGW